MALQKMSPISKLLKDFKFFFYFDINKRKEKINLKYWEINCAPIIV
jgi:hypothetical protein